MKIAVVDDDKIIRIGLCKMIKNLFNKHEVVGNFQNGKAALDYLKENDVDLVITDIKMPVLTGIELMQNSKECLKNPPLFIILSGYDEFSYVRDTMKLGAFNYLLKPIKKNSLKEVIDEVEKKIADNKEKDNLINKSLKILRENLFKDILFESSIEKEIFSKEELESMGINKNTLYRLIVIKKALSKEDETFDKYVKRILNLKLDLQYTVLIKDDSIYLIWFYCNEHENIEEEITKEIQSFLKEKRSVIVFEHVNNIYDLKNKEKIIRDVKKNIYEQEEAEIFYFNKDTDLKNLFINDNKDYNTIAIKITKEYIINNFDKNITLKKLADKVFLSQNYLSELFKKETGEGFYEFLSKYRVERAKQMLITTNLRIYEIGKKVGYNDAITFGRAFKKITGTTPNKFRQNNYLIKK